MPELKSLRIVLTAGETLAAELVRRFQMQSVAELINGYGPTETFYSTFWRCRRHDAAHRIPIGRPVGDAFAYVLDRNLNPTPVGVPGDLYFGGVAVARGYLNRGDLTKERFVADPFSRQENARMYRTGDRARYLADGNLDFLGRADNQVKLRGFRIELGEIEAALQQQSPVREAVVLLREDSPGNPHLVAYVVPRGEMPPVATLRAALKQHLPDYMVPAAFVPLPALPLTPNGKIDRKALPAPDHGVDVVVASRPRDPVEEAIAGIWCELLHLRQIGVDDNFFDLGGHSLLAIQLLSRLTDIFGVELPVRAVFEAPTIAELASRLGEARLCTWRAPRASRRADAAPDAAAAVLRTAAAVVSGAFDVGGSGLQHRPRAAAGGRARCGGARGEPQRRRRAT